MSWDLSVGSPHGPLGSAAEVRRKVSSAMPQVDWSDPTCGFLEQGGYTLEFSLLGLDDDDEDGDDDELDDDDAGADESASADDDAPVSLHISVRGTGDPLPPLVKLCKANGWTLTDDNEEAIDLEHPSDAGWREFQAFRDRVAGSLGGASKPGFFARLFGRKG
jgi:hypothetical protein